MLFLLVVPFFFYMHCRKKGYSFDCSSNRSEVCYAVGYGGVILIVPPYLAFEKKEPNS